MQEQIRRFNNGEISISRDELAKMRADESYRNALVQEVEDANYEGKLYVAVGKKLVSILCVETDPLDLLFGTDLATNYFQELNGAPSTFKPFATYLEALAHKDPAMKLLEIGAGTGGATAPVLKTLRMREAK